MKKTHQTFRHRRLLAATAFAGAAVVAGYAVVGDTPSTASPNEQVTVTTPSTPVPEAPSVLPSVMPVGAPDPVWTPPSVKPTDPSTSEPVTGPVRPGTPTGIEIPDLSVDTDVEVTRVVNNQFLVPHDISVVGWDEGTVKPGAKHGTALMAGHLDDSSGNEGALHDLLTLDRGDTLVVKTNRGQVTYSVTSVRNYEKAGLPAEVVARDGKAQLALVTCGGPLVEVRDPDGVLRNHYRDNVVVFASPVR